MNSRTTARLTAIALSMVLTAAMLAGIDSLATTGISAPQMAHNAAVLPQA